MKKLLFVCALSASLFSCSLLQRHDGGAEEAAAEPATENGEADGPDIASRLATGTSNGPAFM
jgi:hypothetical protein